MLKKIKNYIEENNDKINNKEDEYNELLLKYSEINRELNKTIEQETILMNKKKFKKSLIIKIMK